MKPAERKALLEIAEGVQALALRFDALRNKALDDRSFYAVHSWRMADIGADLLRMWARSVQAEIAFDLACEQMIDDQRAVTEDAAAQMLASITATRADKVIQADAERRYPLVRPQVAQFMDGTAHAG